MAEKIIGILGGMGPAATIDLFTKIIKGTKVKKDQDHFTAENKVLRKSKMPRANRHYL